MFSLLCNDLKNVCWKYQILVIVSPTTFPTYVSMFLPCVCMSVCDFVFNLGYYNNTNAELQDFTV